MGTDRGTYKTMRRFGAHKRVQFWGQEQPDQREVKRKKGRICEICGKTAHCLARNRAFCFDHKEFAVRILVKYQAGAGKEPNALFSKDLWGTRRTDRISIKRAALNSAKHKRTL